MLIAILGPTASGKSALAVEVARRLEGTVVNGDPFQAMEGLAIGTGQPSAKERGGVPHLGYGQRPLTERPNPGDFGIRVRDWLDSIANPVLVTGSGLYLRGIWEQLTELPEVPQAITDRVRRWGACLPPSLLHRYLQAVDPIRSAQLHPNDLSRVQRALALHLATGQRPSSLLTGIGKGVPDGWRALRVQPSRESQRRRIEIRVRAMVESGWRGEVLALVEKGLEPELRELRPLGYLDWLDGREGDDVEKGIVAATRAYAKRQETFFSQQWPDIPTWDPDREDLSAAFNRLGL